MRKKAAGKKNTITANNKKKSKKSSTTRNLKRKATTTITKDNATSSPAKKAKIASPIISQTKMKQYEERFEKALLFKLNGKKTDQDKKGSGNSIWLCRAGYTEAKITKHLLETFKRVFCRRVTPITESPNIPEEDQPWNKHWVQKLDLNVDLKMFIPEWLKFLTELEQKKKNFENIGITSLRQRKLERIGNKREKGYEIINKLYSKCNAFFEEQGIFKKLKADPDKTIIHALFTDHESGVGFQEPHTDFDYADTKKNPEERFNHSWTAHMPITEEGSWITLWFGTGEGYTMIIPFGKILLLRSDVVHGGGTPIVEDNTETKLFRRLHFYLVTDNQPAYPGEINPIASDGFTPLQDMHVHTPKSFKTGQKS